MRNAEPLSESEATKRGLLSITVGYTLPYEQWMLNNTLADMQRGSIPHAPVACSDGVQVWRYGRIGFERCRRK